MAFLREIRKDIASNKQKQIEHHLTQGKTPENKMLPKIRNLTVEAKNEMKMLEDSQENLP